MIGVRRRGDDDVTPLLFDVKFKLQPFNLLLAPISTHQAIPDHLYFAFESVLPPTPQHWKAQTAKLRFGVERPPFHLFAFSRHCLSL